MFIAAIIIVALVSVVLYIDRRKVTSELSRIELAADAQGVALYERIKAVELKLADEAKAAVAKL